MPKYTLQEMVVDGQIVMAQVYSPCKRKAHANVAKPKYQSVGRGALFVAVEMGQIDVSKNRRSR